MLQPSLLVALRQSLDDNERCLFRGRGPLGESDLDATEKMNLGGVFQGGVGVSGGAARVRVERGGELHCLREQIRARACDGDLEG